MHPVHQTVLELIERINETQQQAISDVAKAMVRTFEQGGILQAYGPGHSNSGALELTHRAGGFIPTKMIKEPSAGAYEALQGVGETLMKKVDVRAEDIVFIISNSGRNPLPIEVALAAKAKGATVVAITSVSASKQLTSKHHGGKNLYQVVDYVLDNHVAFGDASITLEGLDTPICGMSTILTAYLIQTVVYDAAKLMIAKGLTPLFYKSQNIDGGREFNEAIEKQYIDRLLRI